MRSLEDHLSLQELASLPESPEALASAGPDQQQLSQHLQRCEDCAALAHTHWSLRSLRATPASAPDEPCPEQDVWLEFTAGLRPEQSSALLAHAASCRHCADTLQEAMQLMQPDQLDTAEPLEGLASATPVWQRRVAAQMMSAAGKADASRTIVPSLIPHPRRTFAEWLRLKPVWITLPVTAAILCAVVLTGITLWRTVHPSDARLLALAYNKQRTLALRIPGGEPVPMASITRGEANGPNHGLADPSELLELRLRAQQHLDQAPNSPYWHQIMGEINLLQQNGLAALVNFEIAQTADHKLPNLQVDIAAAWFEIGENHSPESSFSTLEIGENHGSGTPYFNAANLYLLEISSLNDGKPHPTAPALLHYNLALCWERLNLTQEALQEFQRALAAEKSPSWRKTIQDEIVRLSSHSSSTPTDGYETALDIVTQKLLPLYATNPEARTKIEQTAILGLRHHDRWLSAWIAAPHTPISQQADEHLAAAVTAGAAGEAESSLAEAKQSIGLYDKSHHQSGLLRAELAETYAYQRLGRARECITSVSRIENQPRVAEFAWLKAQSLMEDGNCHWLLADIDVAQHALQQSVAISLASDLSLLHIRALGLRASYLTFQGMTSEASQLDSSLLHICESLTCPPIREYQLLYDMVTGAQDLHLDRVAAELMRTAEQLAARTGDVTTHAYSLETLGLLNGRIGDYKASREAFQEASTVAQASPKSAKTVLYQADWQVDRAEILSREGSKEAALQLLQKSGPILLSSDYYLGRIHYLCQLSDVQRSSGHLSEALSAAAQAVTEAERSLQTLHSAAERDQWARVNAPVYAVLVKAHLALGQNTEALEAWERFRAAPFQHTLALSPDSTGSRNTADSIILIFARIDDTYIAWIVKPLPLKVLRTVVIGEQAYLQRSTLTFYRLCADRDSSLLDVKAVGGKLYNTLLGPFKDQLTSAKPLYLDIDPSLSLLPFAALTSSEGNWLSASTQIKILPAWWTQNPSLSFEDPEIAPSMRAVVVNGFVNSSETTDVAGLFAHSTLLEGSSAGADIVLRNLKAAEVFHFSGHATNNNGHQLLLNSTGINRADALVPGSLQTASLHRCRIVVLAACNTSAADPDQIERLPDLRNAMLLAGAHNVVASNWDVDDKSTHLLMLAFYRQLTTGLSPAAALQTAEQSVRSNSSWNHPFYWAPFEVFTN